MCSGMSKAKAIKFLKLWYVKPTPFHLTGLVVVALDLSLFYLWGMLMAKMGEVQIGDLVSSKSRGDNLFIVIGHTYRVSRWGNRRLIRVFCLAEAREEYILEDQIVVINCANNEKSS